MKTPPLVLAFVVTLTVSTPWASAQSDSRVAVSGSLGVGTGTSDTGVAAGGAVLFDLHEHLSIEGQGTYLSRGQGANAFTLGGGVLLNVTPASEPLVPYVAIGGGMYRASFDLADPRFLGPIGTQFSPGSTVCPAPGGGFGAGPGLGFGSSSGTCPSTVAGYWGVGALPNFYARRLGALTFPRGAAWGTRDFTDPMLNIGGGVRFNLTDRLMVRPDARALVVFGNGRRHTLGVFVVHVGYRF